MSLFSKLFKKPDFNKHSSNKEEREECSKYMPDLSTPLDERFTQNFILKGGKFLYALNMSEVLANFDNILLENDWYEKDVLCLDNSLKDLFKSYNLNFRNKIDSSFFLTTCESLVADKGSLLVCSKQLKEMKLQDVPKNIVVFGTTSQITNTIGEGLRLIKNNNKPGLIPTNITTIEHFQEMLDEEEDFMTYGSSAKNLYLLLLEDL